MRRDLRNSVRNVVTEYCNEARAVGQVMWDFADELPSDCPAPIVSLAMLEWPGIARLQFDTRGISRFDTAIHADPKNLNAIMWVETEVPEEDPAHVICELVKARLTKTDTKPHV